MGTWVDVEDAVTRIRRARRDGHVVVFTNGCFDLLHVGHLDLLERARAEGDYLVVGVNSDASVRRIKGAGRPLVPLEDRARLLAGLAVVDLVVPFAADTPIDLIRAIAPDVLVKGGDWTPDRIVGREEVEARGGRVLSLPLLAGRSTTALAERIRALPEDDGEGG